MGRKRCVVLLSILVLGMGLCSCGKSEGDDTFCVSLNAIYGRGYSWTCEIEDKTIVSVTKQEREPASEVLDSMCQTDYTFVPLRQGTTTAYFVCEQSWNDTLSYYQSCDLTVDAENKITGELSEETAELNLGFKDYDVTCTDSSVVAWFRDDLTGVYTIRPLGEGSTTLTFSCEGSNPSERTKRMYQVTVYDKTSLILMEENSLQGSSEYPTVQELEQALGFCMYFPSQIAPTEIRNVGTLGYLSFQWNGKTYAYVGGDLDVEPFFQNANVATVEGISVGLPKGQWMLAGWEKAGRVYYLSCDEPVSSGPLTELLTLILTTN